MELEEIIRTRGNYNMELEMFTSLGSLLIMGIYRNGLANIFRITVYYCLMSTWVVGSAMSTAM